MQLGLPSAHKRFKKDRKRRYSTTITSQTNENVYGEDSASPDYENEFKGRVLAIQE